MGCPICGKKTNNIIMKTKGYILYSCENCGNGFWWPLRPVKKDWYLNAEKSSNDGLKDYYSALHLPNLIVGKAHRKFFSINCELKGTLLDIGCGNGGFVQYASKIIDAFGIDIDPKAIEAAKKAGLKNVSVCSLSNFCKKTKGKKFSYITFFEVLEHQTNPVKFIKNIKSILKKNGLIAGSVPLHREIKPFGDGDYPPNHFLLFTQDGLLYFLKSQGFSNIIIDEIFEEDEARIALGFSSPTLRRLFGVKENDILNNSIQYRMYSYTKKIVRILIPIINFLAKIYVNIIGKEKIKKESTTYRMLYFQASLLKFK